MLVDDATTVTQAMTPEVLIVGPGHTLRQCAQAMRSRKVGAAVVNDGDGSGLGIITERDILDAVASGDDLDAETAHDHQTTDVVFATTAWTLTQAAEAMTRGGFRHLIVLDGNEIAGMLSVRDIVRAWSRAG